MKELPERIRSSIVPLFPPPFGILPPMPTPTPIPGYTLIRSARRTVSLIIQPDGTLTVRAPLLMPVKHIREFVESHTGWIRRKQAQAQAAPLPMKRNYVDGELFLFLGNEYPLVMVAHQRPALVFHDDKFQLAESFHPGARQAFIRWYKAQALELISERVSFYARQNNFAFSNIRISSARTRWGSCSASGTLSFTWRLVLATPEVIDYVVVHELVHTKIKNHSLNFWHRLAEIMPDYKRHISWLKKNGRFLVLGGN